MFPGACDSLIKLGEGTYPKLGPHESCFLTRPLHLNPLVILYGLVLTLSSAHSLGVPRVPTNGHLTTPGFVWGVSCHRLGS